MGRWHERDGQGEHEGFVVGYVPHEWVASSVATAIGSSRPVAVLEPYRSRRSLRELGVLPSDHEYEIHGVYVVGYGCACGWRSPYRELGTPFEWSPSVVHWTESLEDLLAEKWWKPHVELEVVRGARERLGRGRDHNVQVQFTLPRDVASGLRALLNSLGNSDFNRIAQYVAPDQAEHALHGIGELEYELDLLLGRARTTDRTERHS